METRLVKIDPDNLSAHEEELKEAAEIIRRGGLVAFPTETVYGLGANALDATAAERIYAAKGRPSDNPLIIHVANAEGFKEWCEVESPDKLDKIIENFVPGPITVIQKKKAVIPDTVTAKMDTVAVRCPSNPIARRLIELSGVPIAAPSANTSGRPSPTKAEHVIEDMMGRVDMIIDGGDCTVGLESTIVMLKDGNVTLLRPGGITVEQLTSALGNIKLDEWILKRMNGDSAPLAPGMKYRHYAPNAKVIALKGNDRTIVEFMAEELKKKSVGVICYKEDDLPRCDKVQILGSVNNKDEMAKRLFTCLRAFDCMFEIQTVYTRLPDTNDLGLALANRLIKACGYTVKELSDTTIVGLCGQSGAGKTTVLNVLESIGAVVCDCDAISREVMCRGTDCSNEVIEVFGKDICNDGEIDRKALGRIVFSDEDKLKTLTEITHRYIKAEVYRRLDEARLEGVKLFVIDAPLLFESGIDAVCDVKLAVVADRETRLERIMNRDGIDRELAEKRIGSQLDEAELVRRVNYVIYNDGTQEQLKDKVFEFAKLRGWIE